MGLMIVKNLPEGWQPGGPGNLVFPDRRATQAEVGEFYRGARCGSDLEVPVLEEYLKDQPYDPAQAQRLVEKHRALPTPYECRFGAARLEIDADVFNSTITNVSPFLLEHVDFRPKERVLDAFAGSGAFSVNAALKGADAVAYDNSPSAVACAQKNARKNNVESKIDVRLGTLAEVILPDETFDLIIANPPLVPGDPGDPLEHALFDNGLNATKDFIAALPSILAKGGRCYLSTSDVIDRRGYEVDIAQLCKENDLAMRIIAKLHLPHESYRIHKIEHPSFATWARPILRKLMNA
jgi:tRNA1(Val) A37 N6-methylase TrmN6